jgi:hypothetical protein
MSPLSSTQSKSARRWATEEPSWATEEPVDSSVSVADPDQFPSERLPLGKRASRALTRFLIVFGIGIVATLAWQSYGDAAREMIASSYPQLGWLAPPAAPDASSPDLQELKALSTDLAAVRQSVDQLAAQFVAGQEAITKLHAAEQEILENILKLHANEHDILANILEKISAPQPRPAAAPVRKPLALTPAPLTPPAGTAGAAGALTERLATRIDLEARPRPDNNICDTCLLPVRATGNAEQEHALRHAEAPRHPVVGPCRLRCSAWCRLNDAGRPKSDGRDDHNRHSRPLSLL